MSLERGPFVLQPDTRVDVEPGVYDFGKGADQLASDLHGIIAGWDTSLAAIENFATEPIANLLTLDFEGIAGEIAAQSATASLPYLDEIDAGFTAAAESLTTAIAFAPAQSWLDPGGAFVPPDSVLTLAVPKVDPAAYKPAQNFTVGQYTGGKNPALALFNSTRVGTTNFVVGDVFDVVGLGKEGDDVGVLASLNGVELPWVDYGPMDSSGQFFLHGTMAPEHVGSWHEDWYIGGVLVSSFNFLVTPAD